MIMFHLFLAWNDYQKVKKILWKSLAQSNISMRKEERNIETIATALYIKKTSLKGSITGNCHVNMNRTVKAQ